MSEEETRIEDLKVPNYVIREGVIYNFEDTTVFEFITSIPSEIGAFGGRTYPKTLYKCIESGKFFEVNPYGNIINPNKDRVRDILDNCQVDAPTYMRAGIELKTYKPEPKVEKAGWRKFIK